jgi:CRISPR-associated endonuclease Csn1
MKLVPNNSLRNPLVEQIVRETLFVVKDVWKKFGQPDEIHIELGRDLKKNKDERKRISEVNTTNQQERERIKRLLKELLNDQFDEYTEDGLIRISEFETKPNPESPIDIEKFKIWKNLAGTLHEDVDKYFKEKDKPNKLPTNAEIKKYALWLTQKCKSPYTGKAIPLSKLFTESYEVEHIIPRSRMKYDAHENLVISETGVNKAKGHRLAASFISESNGKCKHGNTEFALLSYPDFEAHCKTTFRGKKLKNLLTTEVPEDFISRQLNDTRHITRKISELLQPIAKSENGIVFTIGSITSDLKREWGLAKEWKKLMLPRFKRLESITGNSYVTVNSKNTNDIDIHVPENPELDLKRIDHRHHALDALIIAATTREHIRYLNSLNAVDSNEELKKVKLALVKGKVREFSLPWETFTEDAKNSLSTVITSIKAKNKVVSKPKNKHQMWVEKDGKWVKELVKQKPPKKQGKKWLSVRKSMFKEPQGIIHIKEVYEEKSIVKAIEIQMNRMKVQDTPEMKLAPYIYDQEAREIVKQLILEHDFNIDTIKKHIKKQPLKDESKRDYKSIKVAKFEEYAAKRVTLDTSFDSKKINKIPYAKDNKSPLAEILKKHLSEYNEGGKEHPELAFYGEGMETLIKKLKKPISKITIYEKKSPEDKFKNNYVEVDAGANVYFIMYEDLKTRERKEMYSLAAHKAIERLVSGKPVAEEREGYKTIILSPNQLVYVPTPEEIENPNLINLETKDITKRKEIFTRVYKMVSCTDKECHFIPHFISTPIIPTAELGSNNKTEKAWDGKIEYLLNSKEKLSRRDSGTTIKSCCIKIQVDRLGNIKLI